MARRDLSVWSLIGVVAVFFTVNFLTFSPALAGWGRGGRFNGGVSTPTPTPSPTPTPALTPTPTPTPAAAPTPLKASLPLRSESKLVKQHELRVAEELPI